MLQSLLLQSDVLNIFIKYDSSKYNMEMLACVLTGYNAHLCFKDDVEKIVELKY
jgi:hypothetical protein